MQAGSDEAAVDAMALNQAVLVTLLEGGVTGYELAKWFDAGVVIALRPCRSVGEVLG
jgi:hypothetical protein